MKRVDLLVAAWPHVRRRHPDARLLLLRPGDAGLAARLEAREGIELMEPVVGSGELAPVYRRAWACVLPSYGDSFGLVLAEALACGTPAVASVHGALPEIVDREGIGALFDPDTPEALAAAILEVFELAADPGTPARCRARAQEFSTRRNVEAHVELYADLLNR
jgi:D-inositol-3-phosphate glycosyltransferase